MSNNQTAVEKLTAMEHLINWIDSDCTPMDCVLKAKELLQMEEDQIISSWENGFWEGCEDKLSGNSGLQYYNETYGK
jgi:hypothetical protein